MSGAVQCSSPLAPGGQITCHAWSAGGELLAVCANASEVEVYRVSGRGGLLKFVREATLREHDMQVVSMDFCGATGRLLTASHDRNAYVCVTEESEHGHRHEHGPRTRSTRQKREGVKGPLKP